MIPPVSDESSSTENMPTGDVARLPPGATLRNGNIDHSQTIEQPVAVSQLTQIENNESSLPPMPNFTDNTIGEELCYSLLSQAFADDWKDSIAFGKRAKWLDEKLEMLYDREVGIFKDYRYQSRQLLQQKLSAAEAVARNVYDSRQHNSDTTGNTDGRIPVFYILFFRYFDWKKEKETRHRQTVTARRRSQQVN